MSKPIGFEDQLSCNVWSILAIDNYLDHSYILFEECSPRNPYG